MKSLLFCLILSNNSYGSEDFKNNHQLYEKIISNHINEKINYLNKIIKKSNISSQKEVFKKYKSFYKQNKKAIISSIKKINCEKKSCDSLITAKIFPLDNLERDIRNLSLCKNKQLKKCVPQYVKISDINKLSNETRYILIKNKKIKQVTDNINNVQF